MDARHPYKLPLGAPRYGCEYGEEPLPARFSVSRRCPGCRAAAVIGGLAYPDAPMRVSIGGESVTLLDVAAECGALDPRLDVVLRREAAARGLDVPPVYERI